MAEILVVDDSEFDRTIVNKVFRAIGNWNAEFVTGGEEALAQLEARRFDLILTDLHMPHMNGLELLERVQARNIETPVVTMTGKGSEELAIEALRRGAANYVIKKKLVRDLPEIVETVMQAAKARQRKTCLQQHLQQMAVRFALPNDPQMVRAAIAHLQEEAQRFGILRTSELTQLGIALEEAFSNAMIHGNLEVSSELRNQDNDSYERLIALRMKQRPYCERKISVSLCLSPDQLTCTIADQGPGFDPTAIPDPLAPENLYQPSGRGLLLIRSFMDEVNHNAQGNQITLSKRLRSLSFVSEERVADTAALVAQELLSV